MTQHDGPVRVSRFEWERLMMMSDLPEQDRFKLLALGIFMSSDGDRARPGSAGLAMFGPHEETWKKLLRRAVKAGWLVLVARGGARRGPGGTTIRRASVYAASVPEAVWERREEILGARPYRAPESLKEASETLFNGPEALKEAPRVPFNGPDSLKEAPDASFKESDASLKEAPGDTLQRSMKEAPESLKEASGGFEGSTAVLPHHVVTSRTSSSPDATANARVDSGGGGGTQQQDDPRLTAAALFLEKLPAPWTVGPKTARDLAPLLLDCATAQGWQPNGALTAKLTENPGGVTNYAAVLRARIADLPKKATARQHAGPAAVQPWCGHCGDGRTAARSNIHLRTTDDGRHCPECHPNATRSAS